jgi:thymidylate kinase
MAVDMNLSTNETYELTDKCLKLVSKPSISFLLDVDEHTAFLRKTDTISVDYLKDRRAKYLRMAEHYRMHVLDANRSLTDVYTECINIIQREFGLS